MRWEFFHTFVKQYNLYFIFFFMLHSLLLQNVTNKNRIEDAGFNPSVWNHHCAFLPDAGGAMFRLNSRQSKIYLCSKTFSVCVCVCVCGV
jgi:hypothetical protein